MTFLGPQSLHVRARVHCTPCLAMPRQATPLPLKRGIHYQSLALIKCQINHFFLSHNRLACQPARVNWRACTPVVAGGKPTSILLLIPKGRRKWGQGRRGNLPFPPVHRGEFCQFPFWWIYYCHSSKFTGKQTGKTHLCAVVDRDKLNLSETRGKIMPTTLLYQKIWLCNSSCKE